MFSFCLTTFYLSNNTAEFTTKNRVADFEVQLIYRLVLTQKFGTGFLTRQELLI